MRGGKEEGGRRVKQNVPAPAKPSEKSPKLWMCRPCRPCVCHCGETEGGREGRGSGRREGGRGGRSTKLRTGAKPVMTPSMVVGVVSDACVR